MNRLRDFLPSIVALIVYCAVWIAVILAVQYSTREQERIRTAEGASGRVFRLQLDQETGLRGYLDTGRRLFLEPYTGAEAHFHEAVERARGALAAIDRKPALLALGDEERLHARWLTGVARPLIANPRRNDAAVRQVEGKKLMDQYRRRNDEIARDLSGAASASDELGRRFVNELISGGLVIGLFLVGFLIVNAVRHRRATDEASAQAELYAREHAITNTLQEAIIMRNLPVVPGLSIHARYRPADEPERLGGDWYDVFALPSGRAFIVVGDVVGHGISATIGMSQLRNMIIAAALHESRPGDILTAANRQALLTTSGEPAGTAVCAFVDPVSGEIQYASAGHPPPLLLQAASGPTWLTGGGLPLGFDDREYATNSCRAEPDSMVVLYTDGLTEFTKNIVEGEALLLKAALEANARKVENPALFIKRQALRDAPYIDDVAIVTVKFEERSMVDSP